MNGFYLSDDIPEIFKAADRYMAMKNPQPKFVDMTRRDPIPGLEIDTNPRVEGPIKFTEDYIKNGREKIKKERAKAEKERIKRNKKAKLEEAAKKEKQMNEIKVELIQLCAQRDMLRSQLGKLDISKKKDSKMIASINVQLEKIDSTIEKIENKYNVKAKEIDRGSRIQRVVTKVKKTFKKVAKKVKKFFRRNEELIVGLASIVLPILSVAIFKSIS